jgi:mono/diheme cytochrome c family protein
VSLAMGAVFLSQAAAQKQSSVTPVSGESWIIHLRRPLEETSMGKTGLLGPATLELSDAEQKKTRTPRRGLASGNQSTIVQGADLYRLNCRACHGEFGLGASPEINSVIDATRATYAPFTLERLSKRGMETTRTQANELANQAKGALLERLHNGGVDMPPFPQLSESEARAIFAYLRQPANIPRRGGATNPR